MTQAQAAGFPPAPHDLPSFLKWLVWVVLMAGLVGMVVSKAMLSIASIAVPGLCIMWRLVEKGQPLQPSRQFFWLMAMLAGLSLLGFWQADSTGIWLRDLKGKLPFVLWALGMMLLPSFTRGQYKTLFGAFIITVTIVAWLSLGLAFADWEAVMLKIKQNGSVPIVAHISHIYFGMMLAFSLFLATNLYVQGRSKARKAAGWWLIPLILNGIALHLLATRTGLIAAYGAGLFVVGIYVWRTKAWKLGVGLLALLICLPLLSYQLVPAFRTRVQVTIWDMERFQRVEDLSHHSASLRLLAWQNAWQHFVSEPVFGVGITRVEEKMATGYLQMGVDPETADLPRNPHNQYLEYLMGWGIVGGIILIMVFLGLLYKYPSRPIPLIFWSFWAIMVLGMMFESVLERQVGIAFFVIFSGMIPNWLKNSFLSTDVLDDQSIGAPKSFDA